MPLLHVVLAARSISMKDEKDAIRVNQKALAFHLPHLVEPDECAIE
jgi:hypothetical protein